MADKVVIIHKGKNFMQPKQKYKMHTGQGKVEPGEYYTNAQLLGYLMRDLWNGAGKVGRFAYRNLPVVKNGIQYVGQKVGSFVGRISPTKQQKLQKLRDEVTELKKEDNYQQQMDALKKEKNQLLEKKRKEEAEAYA